MAAKSGRVPAPREFVMIYDFEQPAHLIWAPTLPPQIGVSGDEPRRFCRLRDAVRFAMEELELHIRGTASITTQSGPTLDVDLIERAYTYLRTAKAGDLW